MAGLKNLPTDAPRNLGALMERRTGQVLSMALSDTEGLGMALFSFPAGEMVSGEKYLGDTMYLVLRGDVRMRRKDAGDSLKEGDVLMVPSGVLHEIEALNDCVLLHLTVSSS
ncbi:MAG: cupin [Dethiosulfovibrio peptidovorans]|nr:MAG: cupin [Dethiosulfovibrio peptidovorans]